MTKKVKTLVITIDRDDDLGKKTSLKGPIVGEKACIKAAETLAISDPGESDANAIFGAIKAYREMKELGENVEVALITGHKDRGIKADREVARQLEMLKEKYGFEDVVLVSDGADDEQLIPVIQGITRIANIQRVVIKQSQAIESSFYLLKEVFRDPHFARIIFGLPGIVLLIYSVVYLLGIQKLSLNITLGILGVYLIFKGFGFEDALARWFSSFKKTASFERASFPLYISAVFVILLALWAGFDSAMEAYNKLLIVGQQNSAAPVISFVVGSLGLFLLAVLIFYAGRIVDMYHRGEVLRIRRYSRSMITAISAYLIVDVSLKFFLAWSSPIFRGPTFLDIVLTTILAIILTFFGFALVSRSYKKLLMRHIKKGMSVVVQGREVGKIVGVQPKRGTIVIEIGDEKKEISLGKVLILKQKAIEIAQ